MQEGYGGCIICCLIFSPFYVSGYHSYLFKRINRRWKINVTQLLPTFQILLSFGSVLSCHVIKTNLFKIIKLVGKSEILTAYIVNDALSFEKK